MAGAGADGRPGGAGDQPARLPELERLPPVAADAGGGRRTPGPAQLESVLDGERQEGTGGGNHLLWGGPCLDHHPFFSRPGWLTGILRYWQHHPCLAYLFCGPGVGPASQSPRPDEALGDCFDLELAYRAIEQAEGNLPTNPSATIGA